MQPTRLRFPFRAWVSFWCRRAADLCVSLPAAAPENFETHAAGFAVFPSEDALHISAAVHASVLRQANYASLSVADAAQICANIVLAADGHTLKIMASSMSVVSSL